MEFDWSVVGEAMPALLSGARLTILITLAGLVGGLIVGFVTGLMRAYGNKLLNAIAFVYIELIRGTPIVVQVMFIYFALPEAGNPGYMIILGIFLVSFSAALISHAPGGLGVLELVFVTGLPDMNPADVIAALLVFRLFYLIIPFIMALFVILFFERSQLAQAQRREGLR